MKLKNFKLLVILSLVLFLGVGYAVVSSIGLSIAGTTTSASEELDVYFTGEKSVSNSSKGTSTVVAGSRSATFKAENLSLGESITFSYVIENNENDLDADISASVLSNSDYFYVELQEFDNVGSSIDFSLASQTYTTLVVKLTMIKTPISSADNKASFTVNVNAVPAESAEYVQGPAQEKTFDFYIDYVAYSSSYGLTWREWLEDSNNTGSLYDMGGYLVRGSSWNVLYYRGERVNPDDYILVGESYYFYEETGEPV